MLALFLCKFFTKSSKFSTPQLSRNTTFMVTALLQFTEKLFDLLKIILYYILVDCFSKLFFYVAFFGHEIGQKFVRTSAF